MSRAQRSQVRSDPWVLNDSQATLGAQSFREPCLDRGDTRSLAPVETAIKTGTSTDYRDAWAIAFDYQHTIAVWMGNLDGSAMDGVTGAVGPAMVLRSLLSEINRNQDTQALTLSRDLVPAKICRQDRRLADDTCESTTEWFLPGAVPPPPASPRQPPQCRREHDGDSLPVVARAGDA